MKQRYPNRKTGPTFPVGPVRFVNRWYQGLASADNQRLKPVSNRALGRLA
jgi:acetoacetate decarboxylase